MADKDLIQFDKRHLWHPYSAPPAHSLIDNLLVKEAEGVYLTLSDNSKVIDAMSSWWCVIHGYNNPKINHAIRVQLDKMAHVMFGGMTHQPAVELAKRLVTKAPSSLQNIFYSDSGSVAVEVAMKMAVQYQFAKGHKNKSKFLSLRSGYHGDTWKAMSVSDPTTGMHHLFSGALQAEYFVARPPIKFGQDWEVDAARNGLNEVEELLGREGASIAGMILEPVVQGAGGMYFYHPNYLDECRRLCDQYDIVLIFDEIATGFGRTGKFFATEHCTSEPDIMCVGKALTGGYMSLAATLCSNKISQAIEQGDPGVFMHGPTFMANPLACSAAIASVELLDATPWKQRVSGIETQLKNQLAVALELTGVRDVRVLGAIGVIEMDHKVSPVLAQSLSGELGVWLRPFGNNIYCMPPFMVSNTELSSIAEAMITLAKKSQLG